MLRRGLPTVETRAVVDTIAATGGPARGVAAVKDRPYVTNCFAGWLSVIEREAVQGALS